MKPRFTEKLASSGAIRTDQCAGFLHQILQENCISVAKLFAIHLQNTTHLPLPNLERGTLAITPMLSCPLSQGHSPLGGGQSIRLIPKTVFCWLFGDFLPHHPSSKYLGVWGKAPTEAGSSKKVPLVIGQLEIGCVVQDKSVVAGTSEVPENLHEIILQRRVGL